jgi:fibronectin type 3 domain-containing protein
LYDAGSQIRIVRQFFTDSCTMSTWYLPGGKLMQRRYKRACSILLGLGVLVLTCIGGVVPVAPAATAATCTVSDKLVNSCRPWWGGTATGYPQAASDKLSQMIYSEQRDGRQMEVAHTYHGVGSQALDATDLHYINQPGSFLITNWHLTNTWADADGSNATVNANIDRMANSIKAVAPKRIWLDLFHEPENDLSSDPNCPNVNYQGTAGTPDQYKAMWANVRQRFDNLGVNNVVWVMNYINYPTWNCVINDVYPGDALVDWVVFNGYGTLNNASFDTKVGTFYDFLTANSFGDHNYLSKTWGIVEWAIYNSTQASAYDYYAQIKTAVDDNTFPKLKFYLTFDEADPHTGDGSYRVAYDKAGNLDPAEQTAFNTFANDPNFFGAWTFASDDTTAPTISLDGPANGDTVSGSIHVTGTANDETSLASTSLLVDGSSVATGGANTAVDLLWNSATVADGNHTLELQATDSSGNVGSSGPISVDVENLDSTPPSQITDLAAHLVNGNQASLSWTAATDNLAVTGYTVFLDGSPIKTLGANTTSYVDTGLVDNSSYDYTVEATDAAGNFGDVSNTATVTTGDVTAPSVPTSVLATPGNKRITLSWHAATDNVGVTGYQVYRGTLLLTTTTALSYVNTGLSDNTTYAYTIYAMDAAGNLSAAVPVSAKTPDATAPTAPTTLRTTLSGTSVRLTWTASTDAVGVTSYTVFRGGTSIATTTTPSYTDASAPQGRTSSYTVRANDAAGNISAASNTATANVPDRTVPSAPTSLTATAGSKRITLAWHASTDNIAVTGYFLNRGTTRIATLSATATSFLNTGLTTNTSYTYRLIAFDAAGNQSTAATVTARAR